MSGFARRLQQAAVVTVPSGGGIIHGRQVNATNTGIAGIGKMRAQLTPSGSITVNTAGTTLSNLLVSGSITVNANNVTISGSQIENSGSFAANIDVQADNCVIQDCTIVPPGSVGSASAYMGVWYESGTGLVIRRCNISYCENNVSLNTNGSVLIEYSYLHDASNVSNPGGHRDCIEVYGGNNVTIRINKLLHPTGETSVVNVAPWWGAASVIGLSVDDNYMDGGHMHLVLDLQSTGVIQNTRVRRNDMGGHTTPDVGGIYWAANNDRVIVQSEAALSANHNAMLWPYTGVDVNHWVNCSDLNPDRSGQIVDDPENPIYQP